MARKFNAGRQGEYLMNNQLFNAYSSIKYLCNGIDQPLQDKQANIVNGALWVNTGLNRNIFIIIYSNMIWHRFLTSMNCCRCF